MKIESVSSRHTCFAYIWNGLKPFPTYPRNLFTGLVAVLMFLFAFSASAYTEDIVCVYLPVYPGSSQDIKNIIAEVKGIKMVSEKPVENYVKESKKTVRELINSKEFIKMGKYFKAEYIIVVYERKSGAWLEGDAFLIDAVSGCVISAVRYGGDTQELFQATIWATKSNAWWTTARLIISREKAKSPKTGILAFHDVDNGEKYGHTAAEMIITKILKQVEGSVEILSPSDVVPDAKVLIQIDEKTAKQLGTRFGFDNVGFGRIIWNPGKMDEAPIMEGSYYDVKKGKSLCRINSKFTLLKEMREQIDSLDLLQEYLAKPVWEFSTDIPVIQSMAKSVIEVGLQEDAGNVKKEQDDEEEDIMGDDISTGIDYGVKERDVVVFATEPDVPYGKKTKWTWNKKSAPSVMGIFVLDGESGFLVLNKNISKWTYPGTTIALDEDVAYHADNSGTVCAFSIDEGKKLWEYPWAGNVAPIILHDGLLIAGNSEGEIAVIDGETGKGRMKKKVAGSGMSAPPVIDEDGNIFVGANDWRLYAVDSNTGAVLWKYQTKDVIYSKPIVKDDRILFGGMDKFVYCLDRKTGKEIWKTEVTSSVSSDMVIAGDDVVFALNNGVIQRVSANDGKAKWEYRMNGWCSSSPVLHENKVFCTSNDGFIYELSSDDGKLIYKFKCGGPLVGSPVIVDSSKGKLVVAGTREGKISAFVIK